MRPRHGLALGFFAFGAGALFLVALVSGILLARDSATGAAAWTPALVALALLPVVGFLSYALGREFAAPIEDAVSTVRAHRAEQAPSGPTDDHAPADLEALTSGVEEILRENREHRAQRERQRRQMVDLLELLSAGVIVLSEDGRVVVANRSAAEMLDTEAGQLAGRPLVHSARNLPVQHLVDRALEEVKAIREPVGLGSGRMFTVEAIPLLHTADEARHVLLLLRDETTRLRTEHMRRDFVANVSHELKTPLAGLSLLASTLGHAIDEDPEGARGFAARITTEVRRLTRLVDDLLTLSRLEDENAAGELSEHVDLGTLAQGIADEFAPLFQEKNRALVVDVRAGVAVRGDATLLHTLIRNLLDNALRYTEPEGRVEFSLERDAETVVLRVRDDGLGIPRDQQDRIFERFYRVDKARSRESGGTGLGLSIVRHIAEHHGGAVTVDSTMGVGSTFTVRLPSDTTADGDQARLP